MVFGYPVTFWSIFIAPKLNAFGGAVDGNNTTGNTEIATGTIRGWLGTAACGWILLVAEEV